MKSIKKNQSTCSFDICAGVVVAQKKIKQGNERKKYAIACT